MSDTLYIIDTFSLVFQVFHGIPPMTGPAGQPTNAAFGFTRDLRRLIAEKQPTHLMCAMDSSGPGTRHEIYPEYKANRTEMPEDLKPQIPLIKEIIKGLNIPCIEVAGWEADDVFATVAKQASDRGFEVRIVTSDKDARQLLNSRTQLYNIRKGTYLDVAALAEDWKIRPDQVVDFQALVGDSVDNIPGVPLVGPKKAQALLEKYETLDEVLKHADEAPGKKLRENLVTYADQALISRKLAKLNTELPLEIDWESFRISEPDAPTLLKLFTDLNFRSLSSEMKALVDGSGSSDKNEAPTEEFSWTTIDTEKAFEEFVSDLKNQAEYCLDLETTGLNPLQADIVGWAFCWKVGVGYYLPVQGPPGQPTLDADHVLETLKPILEDAEKLISNQNIKYDMLVLRNAGVKLPAVGFDPMVGSYLLNAGSRSYSLDALSEQYLNHRPIPISELIGKGKQQKKMFEVDIDKAAEYAAEDADLAWRLSQIISDELRQENLWDLYWDLERPLIPILAEMEFAGIRVDTDELGSQSKTIGTRLVSLVEEIYELAEHEFNIDSPLQLRKVLFDELNLPVMKKTKTGPSTDQSVLEKLAPLHPLPEKIMEHRLLSKLKNTYLDALPGMVNEDTGRIHASFNQVVAATGRLSSSNPNLQNIPIRTEAGRSIRRAFIPKEQGWSLVCADYSQVELRMLAHFSGDAALQEAFSAGVDIHAAVAAEVFGVEPESVDKDMRRIAKAVNFGIIYGQSSFGLSAALGISQGEAAQFIENYFEKYAGVTQFLDEVLITCQQSGFATTILGRRRAIQGIRSFSSTQRNMPERTAINTVIQGSAADLIKQAMINVQNRIEREDHPGTMLLQIHDELVFEVPDESQDSLIQLVREEMEQALELKVPLLVDVSAGKNWLEVEQVEQA